MDWLGIVVAGLVGTAVMTMLMYSAPVMGMPKMNIAQTLGTMVLPQGSSAFIMGMMMHMVNGVIFVAIYAAVWNAFGNNVTWWSGLIFGAVHSLVAAVGMGMLMGIHKEVKAGRLPSPMSGGTKGMAGMVMGHLLFGLVVALVYGAYV
ncbi:MAG: hypothetical protein HY683_04265 [Chloroflexi bacterium]|nr:hypothetical protein [Chloroflexota bacterium]